MNSALSWHSRPGSLDVGFVDYDNVRFHLSTERKTVVLLSMNIRCWEELVQYGAKEVLQREYGSLLSNQPEPNYNVSLQIDLEQVPADQGQRLRYSLTNQYWRISESREAFVQSLALLKRNAIAAPFERAFNAQKELETTGGQGQLMQINYRDEEAIFIQAAPDRVTVIFSTVFREETDRIFGKVFLQVRETNCCHMVLYWLLCRPLIGIRRCPSSTFHPECSSGPLFESGSSSRNPSGSRTS